MKEMLKSKIVMGFVVLMLGIIFVDSSITVRLDRKENIKNNEIVMADLR